jgi:hypothetical protein
VKPGAWAEPLRAINLSTLDRTVVTGFVRSVDYTAARYSCSCRATVERDKNLRSHGFSALRIPR